MEFDKIIVENEERYLRHIELAGIAQPIFDRKDCCHSPIAAVYVTVKAICHTQFQSVFATDNSFYQFGR